LTHSRDHILRGSDVPITVELLDDDLNAIDPNGLSGLVIIVYYTTGNILQKYSLNSKTGYEDIVITNASKGLVEIKLQSATTQEADKGDIDLEVKLQDSNTSWNNDTFDRSQKGITVGTIVSATTTRIDP
jgi:hypothetical protein